LGVNFLKVIELLLPRNRAFNLVFERTFKKFFNALSVMPDELREHLASGIEELFPRSTTKLLEYSQQFGAPAVLSREALEAEWKAAGGQSPKYLRDVLHEAGFTDAYVHEWWVPGTDPVEARDPINQIETEDYPVLVNDIVRAEPHYSWQCGDGSQFGHFPTLNFGSNDGYMFRQKIYPTPDIADEYCKYFYVGGQNWPDPFTVSTTRFQELKRLIYKIKPVRLRCVLMVTPTVDTIQDTVGSEDLIIDTVDSPNLLYDYGGV
jgi:hypothetical protein